MQQRQRRNFSEINNFQDKKGNIFLIIGLRQIGLGNIPLADQFLKINGIFRQQTEN